MDWISQPEAWVALASLTALEIVLGIDNIVFISVLVARLPKEHQDRARIMGLGMAMGGRILLLLAISWVLSLNRDLFELMDHVFSGKDLIMLGGGLFLLTKGTKEIHHTVEGIHEDQASSAPTSVRGVLIQIFLLDLVFSLDSVITAVGMVDQVVVMITAVVIAVGVMMLAASRVASFIKKHPTVKMLALSFLMLVGVTLIADGLRFHVPRGYIYFAMGFSLSVEFLNLRMKHQRKLNNAKK